MTEGVLNAIEKLVSEIYTPDQDNVAGLFTALIDELLLFVNEMARAGYTVNLNAELMKMQEAFGQRDYVKLADVLLYDIKPEFLALSGSGEETAL